MNYSGCTRDVVDAFDARCLGEIHRLAEKLMIALDLIEDVWSEFERILRGGVKT